MGKDGKETRSERVNVSLKPSTLRMIQRLSEATSIPVATIISDTVESHEHLFKTGAAFFEKAKRAKGQGQKIGMSALLSSVMDGFKKG